MTARVSTLSFLEPSGLPRRFFLRRSEALLEAAELSWTLELAEGTRFPIETAEALTRERRHELPPIPAAAGRPDKPHVFHGNPLPEPSPC